MLNSCQFDVNATNAKRAEHFWSLQLQLKIIGAKLRGKATF